MNQDKNQDKNNQDKNLISFVETLGPIDQSCFDAFQKLDISQCSHDIGSTDQRICVLGK